MTEKEFEQLKIGDKVWYVTDSWSHPVAKPYELKVIGKRKDLDLVETSWLDGSHKQNLFDLDCHLTKVKALEASIERCEARIKDKEDDIAYEKKKLDCCKEELAKAKEEEENESGWTRILHNGKFEIAPCSKKFAYVGWFWKTQSEAFKALAEYYKGEYEEAMKKAEKTK